jgi:hypothetical protein
MMTHFNPLSGLLLISGTYVDRTWGGHGTKGGSNADQNLDDGQDSNGHTNPHAYENVKLRDSRTSDEHQHQKLTSVAEETNPYTKVLVQENDRCVHRDDQPRHAYENVALTSLTTDAADDTGDEYMTCRDDKARSVVVNRHVICNTLEPPKPSHRQTSGNSGDCDVQRSSVGDHLKRTSSSRIDSDEVDRLFDGVVQLDDRPENCRQQKQPDDLHESEGCKEAVNQLTSVNPVSSLLTTAIDKSEMLSDEGYQSKGNSLNEPIAANVLYNIADMTADKATDRKYLHPTDGRERRLAANGRSSFAKPPDVSTSSYAAATGVDSPKTQAVVTSASPSWKHRASRDTPTSFRAANPMRAATASNSPSVDISKPRLTTKNQSAVVATQPITVDNVTSSSYKNNLTSPVTHEESQSTDGVPQDTASLSVDELYQCVIEVLVINKRHADMMKKSKLDGQQLVSLSVSQLIDKFQLTPFDAAKLSRFARGWRPVT